MFKPGDRVKLNKGARAWMFWSRITYGNGHRGGFATRRHLQEFRNCVGTVVGPVDWNAVPEEHADWSPDKVGPEIDVRWEPSKLKYCYKESDLELAYA